MQCIGAFQIGACAGLFGLPVANLSLGFGDVRLLCVDRRVQNPIVQLGQELPGFHAIANLRVDLHHPAIALGANVGLLIGYKRPGGGECSCVGRGWRWHWSWRRRGHASGGVVAATTGAGECESQPLASSADKAAIANNRVFLRFLSKCMRHQPIMFQTVCHTHRAGRRSNTYPAGLKPI